VNSFSIN